MSSTKVYDRKAYAARYYAENREKIIQYRRERHADRDDVRAKARAYYDLNKEHINARARERHIELRYGLTTEAFDAMLDSQGGRCAICRSSTPGKNKWHIDHDHTTGLVRGLLCRACNMGLGHFRDNTDALQGAIEYLRKNQ